MCFESKEGGTPLHDSERVSSTQSRIFMLMASENNLYQVLKTPDISTQSGKTYFLLLTFKEMTKRHVKNRSIDE